MAAYEPLADTTALAAWLKIPAGTVRSWASRGRLTRRGRDDHGRTLYSLAEAAALATPREDDAT